MQYEYYIVSYPKSGRTWLRVMMARLFEQRDGLDIRKCFKSMPKVQFVHWAQVNGAKVIYLKRDPRDILVSKYFEDTKRSGRKKDTLSEYIRKEVHKLIEYNNLMNDYNAITIHYQDLHRDAKRELKCIMGFIGETFSEEQYDDAVAFGSFENMRKLEEQDFFNSKSLSPKSEDDPESYKTRRGKVGGHVDYLSKEDLKFIEEAWMQLSYT